MQRRLAAILAADIVAFSALMEADEVGTLDDLNALRSDVVDPAIARHRGRIVKLMGDGMLVEFASVVDAVACAASIQDEAGRRNDAMATKRHLVYRIGVHLGDVVVADDDIFGDGVNLSARLEAFASPGATCVSQQVVDQVAGKLDLAFHDLGEHRLKNIARPIRIFRLEIGAGSKPSPGSLRPAALERPAIAVLPFENQSADPDQSYFADGLADDIITALSRVRSFPVIARSSSFGIRGEVGDLREVARGLGARYLLRGSVRRAGSRVRISVRLVDGQSGHNSWADRYERPLEDIFDLQDEITQRVVATLVPELEHAEVGQAQRRRTESLSAWDWYARGSTEVNRFTLDGNAAARAQFARALELDPDYADAWTGLAFAYLRDLNLEADGPREACIREGLAAARKAVAADPDSSQAHLALGTAHVWLEQWDLAMAETELAVRLNPSNAHACMALGNRLDLVGRTEEGIVRLEQAVQLNPRDTRVRIFMRYLARACLNARDYAKAEHWIRQALQHDPDWPLALYMLASILGHQGRTSEALAVRAACEELSPGFVREHASWKPYADPAANAHFHAGVQELDS